MGKRRTPTELERINAKILAGKEMVFYQDLIIGLGIDTKNLVDKYEATKTLLTKTILENENDRTRI